jgi:hypothetical protein
VVGLMAAVLALGACTSEDESSASKPQRTVTVHGTPAVDSALHGPGTPLEDDFVVPDGASLVGAALPNRRVLSGGTPEIRAKRHWTAVLLVDGAADAVAHALADQAMAAGLQSVATSPGVFCNGVTRGVPELIPADRVSTPPDGVICGAGLETTERIALYAQGLRSLSVEVRQGACNECPQGVWPSLAVVTYIEVDDAAERAPTPTLSIRRHDDVPMLRVRPVVPAIALPRAGTKIQLDFGGSATPVVAGSNVLVPPVCNGCSNDIWMMQPVDGDRAFDAYARALDRLNMWESGPEQHREVRDGWDVRVWNGGNTDTGIDVELFERDGRATYLRITLFNGA